jgi:hypothetical protein
MGQNNHTNDDFAELDPESQDPEEGHLIEEQDNGSHRRRRKRIKVRKRVRIKRKSSPKKKVKKVLSTIAWIVVIAAFIVTIVVLVLQLDLNSKHRNKKSVDAGRPVPELFAAENQKIT